MKRILSAALLALVLVGVFVPQLEAIRRKEERSEDVQRALAQLAQSVADPNIKFAVEILAGLAHEDPYEFTDHILTAGRHNNPRDFPNDFRHEAGTTATRTLKLGDIGDPADLGFFRAGPDGVDYDYDGDFEDVPAGSSCGSIYWTGWNSDTQWDERNAQITGRCQGRGKGSLHFFTNGNERFVIHQDGSLEINGPSQPAANGQVRLAVVVNGAPMWLLFQPR